MYTLTYKYAINRQIFGVHFGRVVTGVVYGMECVVSEYGENITYNVVNDAESYTINENMLFDTIDMALQFILSQWRA